MSRNQYTVLEYFEPRLIFWRQTTYFSLREIDQNGITEREFTILTAVTLKIDHKNSVSRTHYTYRARNSVVAQSKNCPFEVNARI